MLYLAGDPWTSFDVQLDADRYQAKFPEQFDLGK
jgi:hypothetical protein